MEGLTQAEAQHLANVLSTVEIRGSESGLHERLKAKCQAWITESLKPDLREYNDD